MVRASLFAAILLLAIGCAKQAEKEEPVVEEEAAIAVEDTTVADSAQIKAEEASEK